MDINRPRHGQYTMAITKLRGLGVRTPVDVVATVYQKFKNGSTRYQVHTSRPGGPPPMVAKNTAYKLYDLYREGRLFFLEEIDAVYEALSEVTTQARSMSFKPKTSQKTTSIKVSRINERAELVLAQMPSGSFTLRALEEVGIPTAQALKMMERIDVVTREARDKGWTISRLVEVVQNRTIYAWYRDDIPTPKEDPPIDLLMSAAASYAIGMIEGNSSLMKASHDVVRYQTWRGEAHLDTYRKVNSISADSTLPKVLNVEAYRDMLLVLGYYEPRLGLSAEDPEIRMPEKGTLRMPPGSASSDQGT